MDVIGPVTPKTSNGHRFIFVVIDYFTKWVEAASYTRISRKTIEHFLTHNVICRYGLPEAIILDNAKNLKNDLIESVFNQFKITKHHLVIYRPQMNGAVKVANKNIKQILRKMTDTHQDWHKKLPFAIMAYRTSVCTSTRVTPYYLIYGMEVVLPIEV
ncbi:uncharacterized protein LOC132269815 [Cornus florida]|uniref:uncharacterized protein LOC132269815 n=1 Tax=Cornus florida TaxID=4283 RepID=UPI00289FBB4D|nr:uncharacterized protein LOC132269815 [Cornus florida]